jgi:hypothetical protein
VVGTEFQKGHERSGLGLEVERRIFTVPRSPDREYWLEPRGKPHRIPLDMGLDILQILLMSCLIPCMVFVLGPWYSGVNGNKNWEQMYNFNPYLYMYEITHPQ